jgi:hypothetical protein
VSRAERLQAYIDATPDRPTVGVDDCGPWVARWVEQEIGRPIGFPVYKTRAQGYALAEQAGGLAQLAGELLLAARVSSGLTPFYAAAVGDVAVIALSDRETAAIVCAGGIMAVRGERRGVTFLQPRQDTILKAWNLHGG